MNKSKIEKKLDQLTELLDKMEEVSIINSDDSDTWDSDTLYNLVENCKAVIRLLEDQEIKGQYDELGQPLYEEGLCSLVDEWMEHEE